MDFWISAAGCVTRQLVHADEKERILWSYWTDNRERENRGESRGPQDKTDMRASRVDHSVMLMDPRSGTTFSSEDSGCTT